MIGIVDVNNCYASCERAFNPALKDRPIVVLSNNDGCVIARSGEAKTLGIKMGVPAYQIKDLIEEHQIAVFSSNYTLYSDMSSRVMRTLHQFTDEMEVYSIDEAFLNLSGFKNLQAYGKTITKTVLQNTGLPVSIGIAPTKTLAKLANRFSKKYKGYKNVCVIDSEKKRIKALQLTDINDVWGIGRQISKRLLLQGVKTAFDFTELSRSFVRKHYTITGERTWLELRGESCIGFEESIPDKQTICTSRAFGQMVTELQDLKEAVSTYASICAQTLRKQKSYAASIMVFIHTNNFREDLPQYYKNSVIELPVASDSTLEIVKYTLIALERIFEKGYKYKKAGVIITSITKDVQMNMYDTVDREKHTRLMAVLDKLNSGFVVNDLKLAIQGNNRKWKLKQELLSGCYTTNIKDIIRINCKV